MTTQENALRKALDMIECEKHERRHVRRAIIDALKEAEEAKKQKPTAWVYLEGLKAFQQGKPWTAYGTDGDGRIPLYKSPQQKPWVGLTDAEAMQICEDCGCLSEDWLVLHDAIEAKLKEKNNAN